MKYIYWNTKNIEDLDRIIEIIKKELPDLVFLSEFSEDTIESNETILNEIGYSFVLNPGCERVFILKKNEVNVDLSIQSRYYTAIRLKSIDSYVISIHLPSQMFQHMDALKEFIRDFRNRIDTDIGDSLDESIIIIGDFNVNPFEKPMIDFDGFVATNSLESRKEIKHLNKVRSTYYNPTWQLYSNNKFPGTKHFKRPSGAAYDVLEHHYLDQVVLSQHFKERLLEEKIETITQTENFSFFSEKKNRIEGSDHLPILYQFKLL